MKKSSITLDREKRREQAEARQKKYDSLTTEEKIAVLNSRTGNSQRERARLNK